MFNRSRKVGGEQFWRRREPEQESTKIGLSCGRSLKKKRKRGPKFCVGEKEGLTMEENS